MSNEDLKEIIRNSDYSEHRYNRGFHEGISWGLMWGSLATIVFIGLLYKIIEYIRV